MTRREMELKALAISICSKPEGVEASKSLVAAVKAAADTSQGPPFAKAICRGWSEVAKADALGQRVSHLATRRRGVSPPAMGLTPSSFFRNGINLPAQRSCTAWASRAPATAAWVKDRRD